MYELNFFSVLTKNLIKHHIELFSNIKNLMKFYWNRHESVEYLFSEARLILTLSSLTAWSARIRSFSGPYSVRMGENADQKIPNRDIHGVLLEQNPYLWLGITVRTTFDIAGNREIGQIFWICPCAFFKLWLQFGVITIIW